jgi:hypothetical protein
MSLFEPELVLIWAQGGNEDRALCQSESIVYQPVEALTEISAVVSCTKLCMFLLSNPTTQYTA